MTAILPGGWPPPGGRAAGRLMVKQLARPVAVGLAHCGIQ
jgi:hypothetical protein